MLPVLPRIRKAHKPKATSIPLPARRSLQNTAGLTEEAFWLPARGHYFIPFAYTGLWINAGKIVSPVSGLNFGHSTMRSYKITCYYYVTNVTKLIHCFSKVLATRLTWSY